ncbi:hypothetical protein [Ectopseudomonas alcaliphila]|uniref:hypothetical protein n=1 Tax=Ectopseudomonas alcaliphila TaxID=101564 RepID=UPI0027869474|nr:MULTISPECIES: hypothetical protein [Pseudomonas]MDP9942625.1 hypothetical protein [Pseudomonas sp. 3400]MDR7014790.1 hypothetical protein [Pseudomonas alcaliphila]
MKTLLAAALGALLLSGVAQADDCHQQLAAWIEMAHPSHAAGQMLEDERGRYRVDAERSTCKVWPARPHLTLLAALLVREENDDFGEADLQVLVLDNARQAFVARLVEPNRLDWDAIQVDELTFDTAPYRLRGDDLAFGVRISRRNSSRVNPFHEIRLHLYELDAQHLRPLLGELPVALFWGEWYTNCTGEFSETQGVVIITERVGNMGYRDLWLKNTRVERRMAPVDGECQTVEQSTHRYQLPIEYDEERYLLPIELASDPL